MTTKEELIARLSESVLEMKNKEVIATAQEYLDAGYPAYDGIMDGLVDGMNKASALYDRQEYFVTDILLCSDALYAGLDVLKPHLPANEDGVSAKKVVLGVIECDTHDIGKNLVHIMLETAGFEVYDLGRDVPLEDFVDKAEEVDADIIAMSTLMSTAMAGMGDVIDMLEERGIRDRVKVMIGGNPVSKKFADEIGADGFSTSAVECIDVALRLAGMESSGK